MQGSDPRKTVHDALLKEVYHSLTMLDLLFQEDTKGLCSHRHRNQTFWILQHKSVFIVFIVYSFLFFS